ncbi:MAG: hypothetical protein FAZ92_02493 [Accumulibacter sp.]|uniref:hypothetical protein n=1 Tax=Accumulibacter sp. TaxID=2053492 RepID=UPI00120877EC|nr:hypothetical protein [Accumulibacter sp.]TLD45243.1 MAG: hypothetical protein FAZ92_02493 [Accumulibacter sp.]
MSGALGSLAAVNWELVIRILVQCCLFSMSAFFSGSETALFSLSRIDLQKHCGIHATLIRRASTRCSTSRDG